MDWSGTTVDKYTMAPAIVFKEVFEKYKCPISMTEAREPMGIRKDLHIKVTECNIIYLVINILNYTFLHTMRQIHSSSSIPDKLSDLMI